jgi:hypothetical protein
MTGLRAALRVSFTPDDSSMHSAIDSQHVRAGQPQSILTQKAAPNRRAWLRCCRDWARKLELGWPGWYRARKLELGWPGWYRGRAVMVRNPYR